MSTGKPIRLRKNRLHSQDDLCHACKDLFWYIAARHFLPIYCKPLVSRFLSVRIFYPDVQLLSPEVLLYLQCFPFLWDGWRYPDAVDVRTHSQDAFHTSHHDGGGRSGEPMHMGMPGVGTGLSLGKLSVAVRLNTADLRLVVLHGGGVFLEVGESPFPVSQQGFRQN